MGWEHVYGPDVERDWHSPLYDSVLEDSIRCLNPKAASGDKNSYILANQWTFIENSNKWPDILLFLINDDNGALKVAETSALV